MRIEANTSKISNETWKEWVRRLKPNGLNLDGWLFTFRKRPTDGTSGRCYTGGERILITVGAPKPKSRIYRRTARRGYLESVVYSWEESVMLVLAHELRHAWQKQNPRGRKVWGGRGQYSERDADAYAIHAVRVERRRLTEPDPRILTSRNLRNGMLIPASY